MIWTMTEIFIDSVVNSVLRPMCCFTSLLSVLSSWEDHYLELCPHSFGVTTVVCRGSWWFTTMLWRCCFRFADGVVPVNCLCFCMWSTSKTSVVAFYVLPGRIREQHQRVFNQSWKTCSRFSSKHRWGWQSLHMSCFLNWMLNCCVHIVKKKKKHFLVRKTNLGINYCRECVRKIALILGFVTICAFQIISFFNWEKMQIISF